MENQIILYQAEDETTSLEVRVEDETVWLTQSQIVNLFASSKANISEHITHIFDTGELQRTSTVRKFRTVQSEGSRKVTRVLTHYNLDVIISIGYRVNSKRGVQFRIWANQVLKDHLLRGYSINKRMDRIEDQVESINHKIEKIDFQIQASLPPNEGIFFNGQVFDAWVFATNLVRNATESIVLIDNYVDEQVLLLLSKRRINVSAKIYTKNLTKQFSLDVKKHNSQYPEIVVRKFANSHDRFLILDEKEIYHIGASLKDLGKKPVVSEVEPWFAFSKITIPPDKILENLPK